MNNFLPYTIIYEGVLGSCPLKISKIWLLTNTNMLNVYDIRACMCQQHFSKIAEPKDDDTLEHFHAWLV